MKKNGKIASVFLIVSVILSIVLTISVVAKAVGIINDLTLEDVGSSLCPHSETTNKVEQFTLAKHKISTVCSNALCTDKIVNVTYRAHEWNKGATSSCTVCGQTCTHIEKALSYTPNGDFSHKVSATCKVCNYKAVIKKSETCTMLNGVCKVCQNPCAHENIVTVVSGEKLCNDCGNIVDHVTLYFAEDNKSIPFYFIDGQTWQDVLSAGPIDFKFNDILLECSDTSGGEKFVYYYVKGNVQRMAYLFCNGERVEPTDKIIADATYRPGWNKAYSTLIIEKSNGTWFDGIGYEEGGTWRDLATKDGTSLWGDTVAVSADGSVYHTATGQKILCDGVTVKASDIINGSLTYYVEVE